MENDLPLGLSREPATANAPEQEDPSLPKGLSRNPATGPNLDLPEDNQLRRAKLANEMQHTVYDNPKEAEYVLNEARRGLVDLFSIGGLPVDAQFGVFNKMLSMFGDELPDLKPEHFNMLGTAGISEQLNKIGFVKDLEPPTDSARYMGSVARFSTPSIITAPAVAYSSLSKLEKARAVLTEVSSGIMGGLGKEIGGDLGEGLAEDLNMTPEEGRALGETTGAVLGVLSPLPVAKGISVVGGRVARLRSPQFQKELGANKAGADLRNEIDSYLDARSNLARSKVLSEEIPGFQPSLGRASGAPGIQSIERRLSEASSENLNTAIKADRLSLEAVERANEVSFPKGSFNIQTAPAQVFKKAQATLKSNLAKTEKARESLTKAYVTRPNVVVGEKLRALRDEAMNSARVIKNAKYSEVYDSANKLGLTENVDDVYNSIRKIVREDASTFQSMPASFSEVINKWKPAPAESTFSYATGAGRSPAVPKTVGFEELHSLMKRMNGDYFALKNTNPTQAFHVNKVRRLLNDKVDKYLGTQFGEVSSKLREANRFYMDDYQEVFKKGAGGKLDAYNKYQMATPDESVVKSIFLEREKGLEDFVKIYGNNDEARLLLKDGILDNFANAAIRDGAINNSMAANFMRKHQDKLDKLPEIKALLSDSVAANAALIDRQAILRNKITKINGSKLKAMAGVENLDTLINDAITGKKSMVSLRSYVKKFKGGERALSHSIAAHVQKQADPYKYMMDNKDVLAPVLNKLGPNHYKNLSNIAEASSVLKRSSLPSSVDTTLIARDPLETKIGTTFRSALSQARAAAQGRVSQEYILSDIGGKYLFTLKSKEANRLMQAALYDPELAHDLSKMASTVKLTPKDANKIRYHLYSIGARSVQYGDNNDSHLEEVY